MTLQKTIENDLQKTIENDLDFGVPKPLKTIKNAKTPKTSILPPLVDLAHRILKEICVCLRRFICFFSPKPYIYIYIYIVYPRYPISLLEYPQIGPGTSKWPIFAKTPKNMRRHRGGFFGFSGSKMGHFIDF